MAASSQISAEALKAEGEAIIPNLLYKLQTVPGSGEPVTPNSVVEITYKVFVRGQMVCESEEKTSYKQQLERYRALSKLMHCMHATRSLRINAETAKREEEARQELDRFTTAKAAQCSRAAGKYPLAVTLSREALEMVRFDPYMNYVCGCAYFSLGHIELALIFIRTALRKDITNEAYTKKFEEIERHRKLLARDIEEDFAKEDFEQFAEDCLEEIKQKEKSFKSGIRRFIQQRLQERSRNALIGGGFRPQYIDELVDELLAKNRVEVKSTGSDEFEVLLDRT